MNRLLNEDDTDSLQLLDVYNVLKEKDHDKGEKDRFLLYFIIYFNIFIYILIYKIF